MDNAVVRIRGGKVRRIGMLGWMAMILAVPAGVQAQKAGQVTGTEVRSAEENVKAPERPAAVSPAPPSIAVEPPATGAAPATPPAGEGAIRLTEVRYVGDVGILDKVTLGDIADDYVAGVHFGLLDILGVSGEKPATQHERRQRVRSHLSTAARRFQIASGAAKDTPSDQQRRVRALTFRQMLDHELKGKSLALREIGAIIARYQKNLVSHGLYLATLVPISDEIQKGILVIEVDQGRFGRLRILQGPPPADPLREPGQKNFAGKYFSASQIAGRFSRHPYDGLFSYYELYETLYALGSHPDLRANVALVVRRDDAAVPPRRYADLDVYVEESRPIHGVFSVANTGTKTTGEWRPTLSLQHLNLTRRDDVLTLNLGPFSDDFSTLQTYGLNYYRPYYWRKGGGLSIYGGYSNLDVSEVVPDIDLEGWGAFGGIQVLHVVRETKASSTSVGLGLTYRHIEDRLNLSPEGQAPERLDKRPLKLLPLSFLAMHSDRQADLLGGRMFYTLQWVLHIENGLTSDEGEFQSVRADSSPNYHALRLQVARLQPVFGRLTPTPDKQQLVRKDQWMLFLRADGQWSEDVLTPVEEKAIGGMDTVRGFPERVVMGDTGVSGTLELRTPAYLRNWAARLSKTTARAQGSTVGQGFQGVVFADAGWVKDNLEKTPGQPNEYSIASLGLGLRAFLGGSTQIRFDWGFPVHGREDVNALVSGDDEKAESSGRFHLMAQIQF